MLLSLKPRTPEIACIEPDLVPLVPKAPPSHSNCVFCPLDLGIDYTSITYWLFGIGVYHTVWGTLVLNL